MEGGESHSFKLDSYILGRSFLSTGHLDLRSFLSFVFVRFFNKIKKSKITWFEAKVKREKIKKKNLENLTVYKLEYILQYIN